MAVVYGHYPRTISNTFAEKVVCIKQSTIPGAGLGVFAIKPLPKGMPIGRYSGLGMNQAALDERYGEQVAPYALTVSCFSAKDCGMENHVPHEVCIDASIDGNWAGKINDGPHSGLESNVLFSNDGTVYVLKPIKIGDELFVSYGKNYW